MKPLNIKILFLLLVLVGGFLVTQFLRFSSSMNPFLGQICVELILSCFLTRFWTIYVNEWFYWALWENKLNNGKIKDNFENEREIIVFWNIAKKRTKYGSFMNDKRTKWKKSNVPISPISIFDSSYDAFLVRSTMFMLG